MSLHGLALLEALDQAEARDIVSHCLRGIEKENLRVCGADRIAQTPHPKTVGSALTHSSITTDFSEALPELITPPVKSIDALEQSLHAVNAAMWLALDNEWLWPSSMPPQFQHETEIPIAEYGTSHIGQMKHIYRVGLWHRYGRAMQAIAGMHFNYSLPKLFWQKWRGLAGAKQDVQDFQSDQYMQMIRNFYCEYWILPYLFGASPLCMKASIPGEVPEYLTHMGQDMFVAEFATSLRLSDLGYQNNLQSALKVCYNSVDTYADSLLEATQTPYPPFTKIGVKVDGAYRQLSDAVLQIENEFYSPVRPKQITRSGEMPAIALKRRGVEYIEVRVLDLNPFEPLGISRAQAGFMEVFLWYCAIKENTCMTDKACQKAKHDFTQVVLRGRDPALTFATDQGIISFQDRAHALFDQLHLIAEWLDNHVDHPQYKAAIESQRQCIGDVTLTPSARLLAGVERTGSFAAFNRELAEQHHSYFQQHPLTSQQSAEFAKAANESIQKQNMLEAASQSDFDHFLQDYFQQAKEG